MIETFKTIREEVGRFIGLWSALGLASITMLVAADASGTTPLDALRQMLIRFAIPGDGTMTNAETWVNEHSSDIGSIALVGVVLALVGCMCAVGRDSADDHVWATARTKAPVTLAISCALVAQVGSSGLAILVSTVIVGMVCSGLLRLTKHETASDAAMMVVAQILVLALYLPVILILNLFGWSNGRLEGSSPDPSLHGVR